MPKQTPEDSLQGTPRESTSAEPGTSQSYIKKGSEIALGALGVRSHVFATNEERQISSITNQLVHTQLDKVELKLRFLDTMEKNLELEKKALQKEQEELFIQRLALAKHSTTCLLYTSRCV